MKETYELAKYGVSTTFDTVFFLIGVIFVIALTVGFTGFICMVLNIESSSFYKIAMWIVFPSSILLGIYHSNTKK